MQQTTTYVRSWPAVGLASLCVAGTGYVLFEDVLRGGEINVGHVTGVIALVVTIAAGHMLWPLIRLRPFAALGLALLFLAGTAYVVITSAGRTAHVTADKQLATAEANRLYAAAKAKAERLSGAHEQAKQAAASECGSGKGKRCEGRAMTAAYAKIEADEAAKIAAGLRPRVEASDYRQAAELLAVIAGGDRRTYEAHLSLMVPFLLALICEIGAIVFGNLAMEHRTEADVAALRDRQDGPQFGMDRDQELHPGLLLGERDRVPAHVRPADPVDVRPPLPGVEVQREGEPLLRPDPPLGLEPVDLLLGPGSDLLRLGSLDPLAGVGGDPAQILDGVHLLLGHQVPACLGQPHALGHGICHLLVVTGDHDQPLDAELSQLGHHLPGDRPGGVHHTNDAQEPRPLAHDHRGAA